MNIQPQQYKGPDELHIVLNKHQQITLAAALRLMEASMKNLPKLVKMSGLTKATDKATFDLLQMLKDAGVETEIQEILNLMEKQAQPTGKVI